MFPSREVIATAASRRLARRQVLSMLGGGSTLALLAACGGGAASPTAAPKAEATKPVAAATIAPTAAAAATKPAGTAAATTAASPAATTGAAAATKPASATTAASPAATTSASPAAKAATGGKQLRVGLVTDVGKVDDKSFNQSAWEGVQLVQKEGIASEVKFIETTDPKDYDKNIAQFAEPGYEAIVTVGFALGEATIKNAKKYQNIKFIGVDQFQAETMPNLAGLIFDEDKSGYLAGALAALVSKSGTIGAVLSTDTVPPVWRFGEGYRAGAKAVKPDIRINIVYHNDVGLDKTFTDPEWGKTTALSMIDKGADVIFSAGGKTGNGGLLGCAEKGVLAIGVDTDQYLTVPEAQKVLLSSAMKLITPGVVDLLKAVQGGSFKGGNFTGQVGLAPFHDNESKVTAEIKTKLAEIDKGLKDGTIKTNVPPAKPS